MSSLHRWNSKDIEEFYEYRIKPIVEPGYFPSYTQLFERGFVAFYVALAFGKTKKYKNIQAFCDAYGLKRLTAKKTKWTREYVDKFYDDKIKPYVVDEMFPITKWFKEQGGEYWGFIGALNSGRIEGYKSVKDFREQRGLKTRNNSITKEAIDEFYEKNMKQHLEGNCLPSSYWFRKQGGKYSTWYTYLSKKESGYKGVADFCKKNGLDIKSRGSWDKDSIDNFFYTMIKPLMDGNTLLSYSLFKEIDGKYLQWYNAIRAKRVKGYNGIQDFKKKHKLK